MENDNKIKCSFKKHEKIDAIIFCQECCIYMCNKCQNHHSELFEHHHLYNLDKNIKDIFTGFCKEKNHQVELNIFVKHIIFYVAQNVLLKLKQIIVETISIVIYV